MFRADRAAERAKPKAEAKAEAPPDPYPRLRAGAQAFLDVLRVPAEVKSQGAAAVASYLIAHKAALASDDPHEVAEEAVCMHMEAMNVFDLMAEMCCS